MNTTLKKCMALLLALLMLSSVLIACGSNNSNENGEANENNNNSDENTPPPVIGDGEYCINFRNWDDSILLSLMLDEGEMPEYTGKTPTRPDDEEFTYEFSGWNEKIKPADGDYDYYARFTATSIMPPWDGSVATSFEGGSGTEDDPYLIANGAQLAYLAREVSKGNTDINHPDAHFQLTQSIDLGENEWPVIGTGFDLSGESGSRYDSELGGMTTNIYTFLGTFDGNGKTIANLQISEKYRPYYEYVELFGSTNNATICNLNVKNASITGLGDSCRLVGIIAGSFSGDLHNCTVNGLVNANGEAIGGAVGYFDGSLTNISADVQMSGGHRIGGIFGWGTGHVESCTSTGFVLLCKDYGDWNGSLGGGIGGYLYNDNENEKSSISNSWSNANVNSGFDDYCEHGFQLGGLIGYVSNCTITQCYATGNVSYTEKEPIQSYYYLNAGGLVGRLANSNVTDCYAGGNINMNATYGKCDSGGLIGSVYAGGNQSCQIVRCFSYGQINNPSLAGGLIASMSTGSHRDEEKIIIESCISFCSITTTDNPLIVGNLIICETSSSGSGLGWFYNPCNHKKLENKNITDYPSFELNNCYRPENQSIQTDGPVCNLGEVLFLEDINSESFFTDRLGMSSGVWDFSKLDVANSKYPTLLN